MILSAIWNKLNEFTELHERSECNSLNEFNLFQMARIIISFDYNQMGQLPPPFPHSSLKKYGVKTNLGRLHKKAFNMDNMKRFFFCLKVCKLKTRLIIAEIYPYLRKRMKTDLKRPVSPSHFYVKCQREK